MFSNATVLVSVNIYAIKTEGLILQSATSPQFSPEPPLLNSTVFNICINNSGNGTDVQMISRWGRGTELQAPQRAGFEFRKSNNLKAVR